MKLRPRTCPAGLLLLLCVLTGTARAAGSPDEAPLDGATLRIDAGGHGGPITALAASRDGTRLLTGSLDRTVRIWDVQSGELLRTLRPPSAAAGPEGQLYAVAISPDGRLVAAGGVTRFFDDRDQRTASIYLFDAGSGALVRRLPGAPFNTGQRDRIERLAFSPDGKRLAVTRGSHNMIGLYEVATGAVLDGSIERNGLFVDADFDPAGRLLVCLRNGKLRLYDAQLKLVTEIYVPDTTFVKARFAPDGKRIAVLLPDGRLELRSGRDLKPLPRKEQPRRPLEQAAVLGFSSDGGAVIAGGQRAGTGRPAVQRLRLDASAPPLEQELRVPAGASPEPLVDVAALPGGALAFATAAELGVLEPEGTQRTISSVWALRAGHDALRVDERGDRIEVRLGPLPRDRFRFTVSTLELKLQPAEDPALLSPRTEPPPPHRIRGWSHHPPVYFDDTLVLAVEEPAAVAFAPGVQEEARFVLGTSARLHFFRAEAGRVTPCPASPSPSEKGSPCRAQRVGSGVVALSYSGDGRLVVALHTDGAVRWYSAGDGTELLTLYARPGDPAWVLFRPDGTYAAAPGGAERAGWHLNRPTEQEADFFPLARLRRRHERPEAAAAALAGVGGAAMQAPLPMRLVREQLPPTVTILDPADGAVIDIKKGAVVVRVAVRAPAGQKITAVRARIDGRPAGEARGILNTSAAVPAAVASADGGTIYSLSLALPPRDCVVSVTADSEVGPSAPAQLRLRARGAAAKLALPTLWVLSIGVSDYARPELRLRYPAKDAQDLAALLGKQKGSLYGAVEARVLTDRAASKAGVLEALDWLQHRAGPADTTVLMLAGHGINDPATGEYYFLPADAELGNALRSMVPASTLQQVLAALPGRVVLLLDTCHAGGVMPGRRLRGLPEHGRAVEELASVEAGVAVMTAATGAQASAEDVAWQNGAFTKAVLEGLSGKADFRRSGRVTLAMLELYVSERVRELTDGAQTPATARPGTIPDFPLVLTR